MVRAACISAAEVLGEAGLGRPLRRLGLRGTFAEIAAAEEGEYSPV
jgi:hypothetical protein